MKQFRAIIAGLFIGLISSTQANTFKTEQWLTPNGVRVVFYQAMEVPMLDISIAFAAGSAFDGSQFGLSALTSEMMDQGNDGLDATAIADKLADTGAQFSSDNSRDMVVYNLRSLTEKNALEQSKAIFYQIINHPDFPDDVFDREKKQQLMAIQQAQESPEEVANLSFFKNLYQDHPYAHPINGTTETVNAIQKNQVIEFYKKYYVAENAVLVLVGAINSQDAHQIAQEVTRDLPRGKPAPIIPKAKQLSQAEQRTINFPSSQTILRLGQVGIDHSNPNYFPLMVGNYILGGGALVSRLAIEVREKQGLTYGITSQFVPMPGQGPFLISFSTKNKEAPNALKITEDTLNSFIKEGPNQKELESAKQYLTGSFPLSLESNRSIASLLLRRTFYNLPENYLDTYVARINAVTIDEIKQAFKQQVNPAAFLLIKVGKS